MTGSGAPACYGPRLDLALAYVAEAFRGQTRKGTRIPYLAHLLQVMVTVAEHGGDEDQLVAALLHDTLEDVEGASALSLERQFGARVVSLVLALSDTTLRPKPPWRERKLAYIERLRHEGPDLKLISAADKLHNLESIVRDYENVGEALWTRFQGGREGTLWYYREVVAALEQGWAHPLLGRLRERLLTLHTMARSPAPGI
jgi:(p)ppGpp synthase/HD superfamily hydrolase